MPAHARPLRPLPAQASAAAACRRPAGCSASRRDSWRGRRADAGRNRVERRARRLTRRASSHAWRSDDALTGAVALVVGLEAKRRRRRPHFATLVEDLDAALGLLELRVAEARELHAALEERERLLEREVALFERLDDRLELGDGGFEVLDCRIHVLLRR